MKMGPPVNFLPPHSDRELTDEERHLHQYRERFSEDDVEGIDNPSPRYILPRRGLGWRFMLAYWGAMGVAFCVVFIWLASEAISFIVEIFS